MILARALCVAAVTTLCWLLFTCVVYALPLFVGATAGMAAYHTGCGILGAIAIGGAVAAASVVLGETLFARARSPLLRLVIAIAFSAPAGLAAFHAVHGLAAPLIASQVWRELFAFVAATIVAATAALRLGNAPPGRAEQGSGVRVSGGVLARPAKIPEPFRICGCSSKADD